MDMKKDSTQKNEKTVLDRKKWYNKKIAAIMTTLALATAPALFLTGCDQSPSNNDDSSYTEVQDGPQNVPEDIAQLDDASKGGQLVQGRQGCIDKLVKNGMTTEEASKTCDEITAEAQKQLQAQQGANGQPTNTTVVVNNNNNSGGGLTSSPLFWYWLGSNNRPYVYYGSPSSGLTMVHNHYYSGSSGSGSGSTAAVHPPEHLTSNQSTFLATEHAMRPAVTETLASRPGVKVVSVSHFTLDGSHTASHFSSSYHGSSVSSHGGFGGHGVSVGG
jgi:hypothetical protein